MKRIPDPERLLRGFYADELRAAAGARLSARRGPSRRQGPARTILAAAASLAIIAGSAVAGPLIAERPAGLEAGGIPLMAAAFTELADASGLLDPFRAWAEELNEQEDHDDT